MNQLQVWAPNARNVELVTRDKQSFAPPVLLAPATITYRGQSISGYWQTPPGTSVLRDGDGYWFKIVIENGEPRYRIDPYARAMNHTEVYREAIGTAGMAGLAGRGRTGLNRGAGSHENPAAAGKRAAAGRL